MLFYLWLIALSPSPVSLPLALLSWSPFHTNGVQFRFLPIVWFFFYFFFLFYFHLALVCSWLTAHFARGKLLFIHWYSKGGVLISLLSLLHSKRAFREVRLTDIGMKCARAECQTYQKMLCGSIKQEPLCNSQNNTHSYVDLQDGRDLLPWWTHGAAHDVLSLVYMQRTSCWPD